MPPTTSKKHTRKGKKKKTIQLWSCTIFVAIKHISLAKFSESTDLEVYLVQHMTIEIKFILLQVGLNN
jgi:hypothetical protein